MGYVIPYSTKLPSATKEKKAHYGQKGGGEYTILNIVLTHFLFIIDSIN